MPVGLPANIAGPIYGDAVHMRMHAETCAADVASFRTTPGKHALETQAFCSDLPALHKPPRNTVEARHPVHQALREMTECCLTLGRLKLARACNLRPCRCHASPSDSNSRESRHVQAELVNALNSQVAEHRAKDEIRQGLDRVTDKSKMDLVRRADLVSQPVLCV